MRANEAERKARNRAFHSLDETVPPPDTATSPEPNGNEVAVALAWFPQGEYERAIERWPSLAENWADIAHADYCQRLDGNIKWMRAHGVPVRAIAPIVVDDFLAWCEEHDEDPEEARAAYAAQSLANGEAIQWPPGRNEPCWCGSQRKYKKCCGAARAAPMHHAAA
jgi:hypothetical protein